MREVVGGASVWLLALMLIGTTPVGTDDAAHRDQLLHPIVAHAHIIDGHVLVAEESGPTGPGVRLGAGSGADAAEIGLAVTPASAR